MQFNIVFQAIAALAFTGVNASTMAKDHYMKNFANDQVARLEQYRIDHPDLTFSQHAVLDLSEKIVKNFSTDEIPAVEKLCAAAFDEAECRFIFIGENTSLARRTSLNRRYECTCSGESDYCSSYCDTGANCRTVGKLKFGGSASTL